jgi:hypothetical protein
MFTENLAAASMWGNNAIRIAFRKASRAGIS